MRRGPNRKFAAIPALLRRGGRSPVVGGGGGPPAPSQVWDDLTALAGWTFSRASAATDGAPAAGLPVGDVDDYAIDVLREVSAKLGLTAQPAYLLEGARTNEVPDADISAASWTDAGTVTVTTGQTDPSGGTAASRLQAGSGSNIRRWIGSSVSAALPVAASAWTRESSSPGGSYQVAGGKNSGTIIIARGGTASATWLRHDLISTGSSTAARVINVTDGSDRSSVGGVTAGARDHVTAFPQLEYGDATFVTSYIRTSGGAATRASDNARLPLPAAWCADVLTVEVRPEYTSTQFVSSGVARRLVDDGTNRLSLVIDAGACKVELITSGGTYLSPAITYAAGDIIRVEVDWTGLTLDVSVNATPVAQTPITGSWTAGGTAYIGRSSAGTETVMGIISIGGIR